MQNLSAWVRLASNTNDVHGSISQMRSQMESQTEIICWIIFEMTL